MEITGRNLNIQSLKSALDSEQKFSLSQEAINRMKHSRAYIESRLQSGDIMYGVNTGFGAFSSVRISDADVRDLQLNLIRSHAAGVGEPFRISQTRAMMILRANALATGHSGVRVEVVEKIMEFLNAHITPIVPSQGSVGASGDLAPLAHLALSLIGEGEVWSENGQGRVPTGQMLKQKSIQPLSLQAKEGLSLINGCQVMTAVGMLTLAQAITVSKLADVAGAMSVETLRGSRKPYDPLISSVRPHPGEAKTSRNILRILKSESEIGNHHIECNKVQDPYSLRCMPAVHGATKDTLRYVQKVLETESNSSTDNPLVFPENDKILSCGNFHGMPVAYVMDYLGIALTSQASISERRLSKLMSPVFSELPAFLTPDGGLQSGHMIVQYAAASLVSENKVLAHPACVDSIPTSADKEDHVSMGTIAARKADSILRNSQNVLAMEFLSTAQGLDLLRPLKSSEPIETIHSYIRSFVPFAKKDRVFSLDIQAIEGRIQSGDFLAFVESLVGELEV